MLNYDEPIRTMSFDINSATECIVVSFYDVYVFPHSISW